MGRKTNNQLKFSQIKTLAKQSHEMEEYEFEDGQVLKFYPTFAPSRIDLMLASIKDALTTEKVEMSEELLHKFILFNIIKFFTHLQSQFKATTLSGQLAEMEAMIDSNYFEKIIDDVLVQSEIHKVFDKMSKLGSQYLFLEKMTEQMYDQLNKLEIKNKDILSSLNKVSEKHENVQ